MRYLPVLLLCCLASADKHHHCKLVTGEEKICKMVLQPSQKEASVIFLAAYV